MRLEYDLVGRSTDDNAPLPVRVLLMQLTEKGAFRLEVGASVERLHADEWPEGMGELASGMHGLTITGLLDMASLQGLPPELERLSVLGRVPGASPTDKPDESASDEAPASTSPRTPPTNRPHGLAPHGRARPPRA